MLMTRLVCAEDGMFFVMCCLMFEVGVNPALMEPQEEILGRGRWLF